MGTNRNLKYACGSGNCRGFTLAELLLASAMSLIVLGCVYSLFSSGLTVRWHLSEELTRNDTILVLMKEIRVDIQEANLACATTYPATMPAPQPEGPQEDLMAIAIPRARDITSGVFRTHDDDGTPIWQSLRIYYLPAGATSLMMIEVTPSNPVPFDSHSGEKFVLPLASAEIRKFCTAGISSGYSLVDGPKVVARNIEWFGPQIEKTDIITPAGERTSRYCLSLGVRLFYGERNSTTIKRLSFQRLIFSDNSMFQIPGPSHTPLPTPTPAYPAPTLW